MDLSALIGEEASDLNADLGATSLSGEALFSSPFGAATAYLTKLGVLRIGYTFNPHEEVGAAGDGGGKRRGGQPPPGGGIATGLLRRLLRRKLAVQSNSTRILLHSNMYCTTSSHCIARSGSWAAERGRAARTPPAVLCLASSPTMPTPPTPHPSSPPTPICSTHAQYPETCHVASITSDYTVGAWAGGVFQGVPDAQTRDAHPHRRSPSPLGRRLPCAMR